MEPLGVLEGDKHPQVIWTRQGRVRQTPRRLWLIILFCSASLAAADNALLFGSLWAPSNEILGDKRISPGPIWVCLALCVGVTIRMVRLISAFSGLHQVNEDSYLKCFSWEKKLFSFIACHFALMKNKILD